MKVGAERRARQPRRVGRRCNQNQRGRMARRQPQCGRGGHGGIGIEWKTPGPMPGPAPFCGRVVAAASPARPRDRLRSGAGIPGHSRQSHGLDRARPSWRSLSRKAQHGHGYRSQPFPREGRGLPCSWYRQGALHGCCWLAKRQTVQFARQNRRGRVSHASARSIVGSRPGGRRVCPGVMLKVSTRRPKHALPPPGLFAPRCRVARSRASCEEVGTGFSQKRCDNRSLDHPV